MATILLAIASALITAGNKMVLNWVRENAIPMRPAHKNRFADRKR
jgi:hypothetical protein